MRVLDAPEDRELAARAEMDLELAAAIDDVIVDALAVLSVRFAAGPPAALEDLARVRCEGCELRNALGHDRRGTNRLGHREHSQGRTETGEKPGSPGERRTHGAPFVDPRVTARIASNHRRNPQLTVSTQRRYSRSLPSQHDMSKHRVLIVEDEQDI